MINLIRNENMKIYSRIRTWIMLVILVAVAALASELLFHMSPPADAGWQERLSRTIADEQRTLAGGGLPQAVEKQMRDDILINQYRLAHDLPPDTHNLWPAVMNLSEMIFLVTIFTVIIAGDIVAGEFSAGTVKLLLIRPASRSKILLSKYAASFLFSMLLLAVLFLSAVLVNMLLYGSGGLQLPYLSVKAGEVTRGSMLLHALGTYGLACIQLIMIVSLAFMISTVFRSSALAIGLSIFIMFVGPQVTSLLAGRYPWIKYTLFANTDLSQYLNGSPMVEGMTLPFSILMLVLYFVLFNGLSWTIFNKRDVAA